MDIDLLREKLAKHYAHNGSNDFRDVHKLTDDEVLHMAKDLSISENNDDDTIDGIPAPIFFDLFL